MPRKQASRLVRESSIGNNKTTLTMIYWTEIALLGSKDYGVLGAFREGMRISGHRI